MKGICLLDGGVGQEIYKRAQKTAHPLWSTKVMMDRPDIVKEVHKDFMKAGARIITINSYACTPTRLERDGEVDWFERLQRQALNIALEARDDLGSQAEDVQIAGCLPPLAGSYEPDARPFAELKHEYEQIVALQAPVVDLFLIETISTVKEAQAAVEAALETDRATCLGLNLSDEQPNTLRSGESIAEALAAISAYPLAGLMFNCSLPETIGEGLKALRHLDIPYGGYANGFASVDLLKIGGTVDALSARKDLHEDTYADHVMSWIHRGATMVGGCCEISPSYIDHLRNRIEKEGYTIQPLN
ncbi:MAG: homocysteine S-methyltransferase family protein [Spirochaetaceae bacterium]|nr:MAG: homocysteine S-methyltransferase family protein [Spirochaetaceae bacterium]